MNKKIKNIASVIQTKSAAVLCTLCAVLFLASCAEDEMADGTHSQKQDLRTVSVNFNMPADKPSFGDGTASRAALDAQPAEILLGDSTLVVSRAEGGSQSRSESTSSAWENDDQILVKIDAGSTQGRLTLQYIAPAAIPAPASGEEPQTATAGWYLMKDISYVKYTGDDFTAYNAQGVTPMIAGDTSDDDELAIDFTEELTLHLDWTASQPTVSIIYAPDMQWSLAQDNTVSMEQKNPATTATTAPELWTVGTNGWVTNQARLRVNTGNGNAGDVVTLTSSAFDSAWEVEPTEGEGENAKTVYTATTDAQGNAYFYGATTGNAALTSNFIVQLTQMRVPVPQPAPRASEGRSVSLENENTLLITLDTPITLLEASDVVPVTLAAKQAYKLMAEEKRTAAKTENINTLGVIDGTWGFESDPQGNLNDADAMAVQIKTAMAMGINQFTVVNGLTSLAQMYNTKSIVGQAVISSTRATGVVSLVLNEDITSLQNVAFAYCMPLGSLSASAVTTIGAGAFNSCVYLTSLTFDKVITSVGTNAFFGNIVSTSTPWTANCDLTLAAGQQDAEDATLRVTASNNQLMWAGKPWKSIKVGETVYTAVGDNLCSSNNGVTTTVNGDVTYAVIDGQDEYSVTKGILDKALALEPAITNFYVVNELKPLDSNQGTHLGEAIKTINTNITLKLADATSVPANAFDGCTALASVSFEKSVTIGDNAFSGCTALTGMDWTKVTSIGAAAFGGCTITGTLTIGEGVTVNAAAFQGAFVSDCDLVLPAGQESNVTVSNDGKLMWAGAQWKSITLLDGPNGTAGTKYTIVDGVPTVEVDGTIGGKTSIVADDVTAMKSKIKVVADVATTEVPAKVIVKNGLAAYTKVNATEDDIYAGTVVGEAIRQLTPTSAEEPRSAETVNYNGRITLTLADATVVPELAFIYCEALQSVTAPAVTTIGKNAFALCYALTSVSLPEATNIGEQAFALSGLIGVLSLPEAETIGIKAFLNCTALTSVSLPNATTIDDAAFVGTRLTGELSLPAATTIGTSAFQSCTGLTSVSLPAAETIGTSAFQSCTSLMSVSLPNATTIRGTAFQGCTDLTTVLFGTAVTRLGNDMVFDGVPTENCALTLGAGQQETEFPVSASGGQLMWAGKQWQSITVGGVKYAAVGVELYAVIDGRCGITSDNPVGNQNDVNTVMAQIQAVPANTKILVTNRLAAYTMENPTPTDIYAGTVVGEAIRLLTSQAMPPNTSEEDYIGSISLVLDDGITEIPDKAFMYCKELGSVVANGVTTIGIGAFYECTGIKELTFGKVITEVGNDAFGLAPRDNYYCWSNKCVLTLKSRQLLLTFDSSSYKYTSQGSEQQVQAGTDIRWCGTAWQEIKLVSNTQ